MVDPGDLAHVLDSAPPRRRASRRGSGMVARQVAARRPRTVRRPASAIALAAAAAAASRAPVRVGAGWFTNLGTKVTMQTPAVAAQRLQHVVGDVARVSVTRPGRGVAEDHRRLGDVERVAHRVGARRGRGRPACRSGSSRARPRGRTPSARRAPARRWPSRPTGAFVVVGQRQVAHPERVQHPQRAERAVDRVPALGAHQRGDPARAPSAASTSSAVRRQRQLVGVPLDQRRAPRRPARGWR